MAGSATVRRPNKLRGERRGIGLQTILIYDGTTVTLFDALKKQYASRRVPGTLPDMFTLAYDSLELYIPISDLLWPNVFPLMMQNVTRAVLLPKELIDGITCDHLAFSRPDVQFQIWVADTGAPLPRKYIVTDPGTPALLSITATVTNWTSLDLQQGDVVSGGSMLAKVRDTDYVDNVKKSQANLDKANAALEKSTNDFRRATNLQATNSITGPDYDSAKQEYETSKAAVDGASAQLNEAQTSLGYATLTAPMNGTLLQRKIEVGDLVGPGTTGFVLADVSYVKVVFGMPDVMLKRVARRHRIQISTASVPGKLFTGTVTAVSPSADANTRVSEVEVSVPNASGELRDGMVASLEVPGDAGPAASARAEAIAVPLAAVVQSKSGDGDLRRLRGHHRRQERGREAPPRRARTGGGKLRDRELGPRVWRPRHRHRRHDRAGR